MFSNEDVFVCRNTGVKGRNAFVEISVKMLLGSEGAD